MQALSRAVALVLGALLLCGAPLLRGAEPRLPPAAAGPPLEGDAKDFSAEPYVLRSLSSVTTMKADGTGTREQSVSITIQSEAALRQFGVVSLTYPSRSETAEFVYARVRHRDGTTQETPVTGAVEQPAQVTREAPFYSDLQVRQLPIKNLGVGDTLEWQARFVITRPDAPGQFWGQESFATGAVILDERHELRVPSGLHLTVWTSPHAGAKPSESEEGGQHIYRWRHAELTPTVGAAAEARKTAEAKRLLTPDEELDAAEGKLPSIAWTTFPDWAAVGAWYRDLMAGRTAPDGAIRSKVAQLTAGKTTDLERAEAIYGYVSGQIRYIGVAFGVGRFQPHTAAEVLSNQYGDCKDKHTLLASMLSVAGLQAEPVLIGAGIRFNPAVPSPAAFNHLITRLALDGKEVWLDSTTEVAPWRALVFPIRDHKALAIPLSAPAVIVETPADLPYRAYETSVVTGSLDAALTSDSQISLTFRDDNEIGLRAVLRTVSPADYGTFVQRLMQGLGFGGTTSDSSLEHLEDASQPLVLRFHYHRVKESDWGKDRITMAFAPIGLPSFSEANPPTSTILLGSPRTETSTVEMQLPPRWGAELPEATHAHEDFATCDVTYHLNGGKLYAERRLVVLKSKVAVSSYKRYQSWYDTAGAASVPYVQLKPPPASSPAMPGAKALSPEPAAGATTNAEDANSAKAANLVADAEESMRQMDVPKAREELDRAKALDPGVRSLWAGYADVDARDGQPAGVVLADLQKELALHPDEVRLYSFVAQIQRRAHDNDGALATSRMWVKNAPANLGAELTLLRQMLLMKQNSAALAEAEAAIARFGAEGDTTELTLVAAEAEAGMGHTQQAASRVRPLLKTAKDPRQVNSICDFLAEAGTDLPAAEAAERGVLAHLEAESAAWDLTEPPSAHARQQTLLFSSWDTLGWILFGEHRAREALGYVAAAWQYEQDDGVQRHLTTLASALHDRDAAALAQTNEQGRRTFSLGAAKGRHGTAEFRLLIADGKAADLRPTGDQAGSAPASGVTTTPFPGAAELIRSADLHALLPPGGKAHLVRSGFVSCSVGGCELILVPLGMDVR